MKKFFYFLLSALVMLTASCSREFDFNKEIEHDVTIMVEKYGFLVEYLGTDVELNGNFSDLSKDEVRIERFASYYRLDSALYVITRSFGDDSIVEDFVTDDDFSNVRTFNPKSISVSLKNALNRIYHSDVVRPESNHMSFRWVDGEDNPNYVFGELEIGVVAVDAVDGEIVTMYHEPEFSCEDCEVTEACEDCADAIED